MALPYSRSYWVVPDRLMAGYYPGSSVRQEAEQKLGSLLDCGIRTFINLTESGLPGTGEAYVIPYDRLLKSLADDRGLSVAYHHKPIRDITAPSVDLMVDILDVIDASLAEGRPVYVHCRGGGGVLLGSVA